MQLWRVAADFSPQMVCPFGTSNYLVTINLTLKREAKRLSAFGTDNCCSSG